MSDTEAEHEFVWSVDTASLMQPKEVLARHGTDSLVAHVHEFNERVLLPAGIDGSLSLQPAANIETAELARKLAEKGVIISSGDIPMLQGPIDFLATALEHGYFTDAKTSIGHIAYAGVTWLNTPTEQSWANKVSELCANVERVNDRLMLRTSSEFWKGGNQRGQKLLEQIKRSGQRDVMIAVEINAYMHDGIPDFIELINRLRYEHAGEVDFGLSFDTGHMAEAFSKSRYRNTKTIGHGAVETVFDDMVNTHDIAQMICMIELDQIDAQGHTHLPLNAGVVDFNRVMKIWGEHMRTRQEDTLTHVVIETNPADYRTMVTKSGNVVTYMKDLKTSLGV